MSPVYRSSRPYAAPTFVCVICALILAPLPVFGTSLTLAEAEQRAIELDPVTAQLQAQAAALSERAVADGQLPDPELSIGIAEVPLNNFDLGQHEDTETQFGLSQAFPPGHTLRYRTGRMDAMAGAERARAVNQKLAVLQSVRGAYVELQYRQAAERVLESNRDLFHELAEAMERQYAQGRGTQHEVMRARLELSLIEDRIEETEGAIDVARAELGKWVGTEMAARPVSGDEPALPPVPSRDDLIARLAQHPLLAAEDAEIDAADQSVALAQEQYKPQWMLDFMVSDNTGSAFDLQPGPDFAGVWLKMSLPIFTNKRQDRALAASRQEASAARFGRADRLRELVQRAESEYATLLRLGRRLDLYRDRAAVEADQAQEAALHAYQNNLIDFETLVRTRALALETGLEVLRLRADLLKTRVNLLYLSGEQS